MKPEDFRPMNDPAVALYLLALTHVLQGMIGGEYCSFVPSEVQEHVNALVTYFRDQLPEDGFMVIPTDLLD